MINRTKFYDNLRKSKLQAFHSISQSQVNGIEAILDEYEEYHNMDIRWLAYMLATVYHETNTTMQPIEEIGKGRNRPYGKKIKHSGTPYNFPNQIYYGRGLVQLTWYENYELMGRLLHIDLLNHPELALDKYNAVRIMFEGMMKGSSSMGDFTGKCLEQYFNGGTNDPVGARHIINGSDKADLIAGYYNEFMKALTL